MNYATCHPDRLARARGLCGSCYEKARRNHLLAAFPTTRQPGTSKRAGYWREWRRQWVAKRRAA